MLVDGSDGQMEGQTALCHNEIFFSSSKCAYKTQQLEL